MKARALFTGALFAVMGGCTCVSLDPKLIYACASDQDCPTAERCVQQFCTNDGGSQAGGAGGGASGGGSGGGGDDGGCSTFDVPDDMFLDEDCDGIDGTAKDGLFVDSVAGNDANPGSRAAPLATLEQALKNAAPTTHSIFLSSGDAYRPTGTLNWDKDVSIYGGYHAEKGWQRDDVHADIRGTEIAIRVSKSLQQRVLDRVDVHAANASNMPGQASIGIISGGADLKLEHVTVRAGSGGNSNLPPPPNGADGPDGMNGGNGGFGALCLDGGMCPAAAAGAGSVSPCLGAGFAGGHGGTTMMQGERGQGSLSCSGAGGAGTTVNCVACPCTDNNFANNGANGGSGLPGAPGDAGTPGGNRGFVDGGTWAPSFGGAGGAGRHGEFGCGGGGGGGLFLMANGGAWLGGSSGGGGGAAGCAGLGGPGGKGGGASIALLIIGGRVDATLGVQLVANTGGMGGPGGLGGAGGAGGMGGKGGPIRSPVCTGGGAGGALALDVDSGTATGFHSGAGGTGGEGGPGGMGGHGGAGAGGPSVVVYCVSGGAFTAPTSSLTPGQGGSGGVPNGDDGLVADILDCAL